MTEHETREALLAELERLRLANAQLEDELARRPNLETMAFLGHKVKTLLNAILGFASLLEDETAGMLNEEQHYYINRVIHSADLMHNLVNELVRETQADKDFFAA